MATTPTTDADAYQELADIRERVEYEGTDFFDDNAQLRFDQLLVRLEREARGIFETLWGDQSPLTETDRVDTMRTTDDAAMLLVHPVNDVSTVEVKRSLAADWDELDERLYDFTDHRLVLARRPSNIAELNHGNPIAEAARRASWRDLAVKVRVTYDRGYGDTPPSDIVNIQLQMIRNALAHRKAQQTAGAASPEELGDMLGQNEMLTEDLRMRIDDVTTPSGATMSI